MSRSAHRSSLIRLLKISFMCVVLASLLAFAVSVRLRSPLPTLQATIITPPAQSRSTAKLTWPATGQAAIGAQGLGVQATNGPQTPAPTASIAKLITALAVLSVKPIATGSVGPTITMTTRDVQAYQTYNAEDGSVAAVTVGEQISEYQLLQGMLLPSANNMADSLAIWAFGSLPAYRTYATTFVEKLGMDHTRIGTDASGFAPTTTSTASDLVKLGEAVEKNSVLTGMVAQRTAVLPVAGTVKNVNWLLGTAGITGLKTGNSNQAGGVYLFSAPYALANGQTITLIGAVMQSPTLQTALDSALPLLVSDQKAFVLNQTYSTGQAFAEISVPWSTNRTAILKQPIGTVTWLGLPLKKPRIALTTIRPPATQGQPIGSVYYNETTQINGSPLILSQAIPRPSAWWHLLHG